MTTLRYGNSNSLVSHRHNLQPSKITHHRTSEAEFNDDAGCKTSNLTVGDACIPSLYFTLYSNTRTHDGPDIDTFWEEVIRADPTTISSRAEHPADSRRLGRSYPSRTNYNTGLWNNTSNPLGTYVVSGKCSYDIILRLFWHHNAKAYPHVKRLVHFI